MPLIKQDVVATEVRDILTGSCAKPHCLYRSDKCASASSRRLIRLSSRCNWVDSSAPIFHLMSRVYGHRSADTAGQQCGPPPGEPINIKKSWIHSESKNRNQNLTFSLTNGSNPFRLSHAVGECVFAYTLAYTVCKGQGRQQGFTTALVSSVEQHVWLIMMRSLSKEQNELKVDCR